MRRIQSGYNCIAYYTGTANAAVRKISKPTQRNVVAVMGKLYDPLRFLSLTVIQFNMLLFLEALPTMG